MDKQKYTKRLSRDTSYNNKKKSYQDKLSPAEIKKKLEEYKQTDDISQVALNSHVRYFSFNPKTGEKQFRLGGFLRRIDMVKGYVILVGNNNLSWSVQIKNSVFFQKMTFGELKQELKEKYAAKYQKEIRKLKVENKKLKNTLREVKRQAKMNRK